MKLPFLVKPTELASSQWPWPACGGSKTLSFREAGEQLSHFIADATAGTAETPPPKSFLAADDGGESTENIIRGVMRSSDRLFFEAGGETSSILERESAGCSSSKQQPEDGGGSDGVEMSSCPFKDSEVVAMDSWDPFVDFRRSMEEMVEAQGIKDWDCLEMLLIWYLRANAKSRHGYILGAFMDLLVTLPLSSSSSSPSAARSFTSPLSFSSSSTSSTSRCISSLIEEVDEDGDDEIEKPIDCSTCLRMLDCIEDGV